MPTLGTRFFLKQSVNLKFILRSCFKMQFVGIITISKKYIFTYYNYIIINLDYHVK